MLGVGFFLCGARPVVGLSSGDDRGGWQLTRSQAQSKSVFSVVTLSLVGFVLGLQFTPSKNGRLSAAHLP